ncbi:MAG: beta-N-acetylhexosaminidase [Treponemataceae bacterium]|nr:beta-N-acetylhexosaminidase [Treponemataceae bacterium]
MFSTNLVKTVDALGLVPQPEVVQLKRGTYELEENWEEFFSVADTSPEALKEYASHPADDESYILDISRNTISVEAAGPAGWFYAYQTVRQLYLTFGKAIPCVHIEDTPAFAWRGFMLDCCRNFYSLDFIKKLIDTAALHKLNRFHWHLTDDQGWRIEIPAFPKLTEVGAWRDDYRRHYEWPKYGGFYSADQIMEVIAYAAERHIIVVPEIETPGHASAILTSYPEFGCTGGPYQVEQRWGIFDDVLCLGNEAVFEAYDKIFDYVCTLFPGPYIHMGGDECPHVRWETCPKCQARMKAEGITDVQQLQSYGTTRFARMIISHGKLPIGWDEVLDGTEQLGLPKEVVVQSWRGVAGGVNASRRGHKVIMSPNTMGCYLDYQPYDSDIEPGVYQVITVKQSYDYTPVLPEMTEEQAACVIGGQGNLWTEAIYSGRQAEYMLYPRLSAIAESLWCGTGRKDFESFKSRLPVHKDRLRAIDINYYNGPVE